MVPTKMTDLFPKSLTDWFTGRRRPAANGSLPADSEPPVQGREDEPPPQPPAKRARYDLPGFYIHPEPPSTPSRLEPERNPIAGPSGYKFDAQSVAGPSGYRLDPQTAAVTSGYRLDPQSSAGPSGYRLDPQSVAGSSVYKPEQTSATTPAARDERRQRDLNACSPNRSVTRHSIGKKRDDQRNKKESPLKPPESPVRQSMTPAGSPFYRGRTRYGGAGATYIDEPNIRQRYVAVPSQPLCQTDNSISATTRRLMGVLERCSTPSFERRPSLVQVNAGNHCADTGNVSLMGRTIATSLSNHKTNELQISHLPTLLKLRQGSALRESTRAARSLNNQHGAFTPYPAIAPAATTAGRSSQEISSAPIYELSKQTNKIKSQISRGVRKDTQNAVETEIAPSLSLPEASLKIDRLPKISFSPPAETKKATDPQVKLGFEFSLPQIVTHNHISVPKDIAGFKFSKPQDVERKLTNGPDASTPVEDLKAVKSSWDCDDCWVVNKGTDERCCACSALRQSKPDCQTTKEWQCKGCWVFNQGNADKCISCSESATTNQNSKENFKVIPVAKEWRCSDCWIQNKDEILKCVACGGSKPGSVTKPAENLETKDGQCSDCVFNKGSVEKCIACRAAKPTEKTNSFEGFLKTQSSKWTCNDCWVSNDELANECVSCGGANPKNRSEKPASQKSDSFSDLVKKQNELWECPSCLTRNSNSLSKCVCCESARPGSKKNEDTKFNFSATPAFKFGIPAEVQKVEDKSKEIAVESNNNNAPKSVSFTFGVPKASEKTESEKKPPSYSFGMPAATDKPSFAPEKKEEKSEVDGPKLPDVTGLAKTSDSKEPAFKLPAMSTAGLFKFAANSSNQPAKTSESKESTAASEGTIVFGAPKTAESPSSTLFGIPSSTAKNTATLFGTVSTSGKTETSNASPAVSFLIPSTDNVTATTKSTLFGIPSMAKTEAPVTTTSTMFGIHSSTNKTEVTTNPGTLFGIPSIAKTDGNTSITGSTLFGIPSTAKINANNSSPTVFGITSTAKSDANTSGTLFGTTAKSDANTCATFGTTAKADANTSGSLFGSASLPKPDTTKELFPSTAGAFSLAKAETAPQSTNQSALFTFGASTPATTKSSKFNFTFGSANEAPPSFSASFGSSKPAPAFGTPTTLAKFPTFGTPTTQASSVPTFGATAQANSPPAFGPPTQSSAPAFGSSVSRTPAFGSPVTQSTFGGSTNQPPAFGAPTSQATNFGMPTGQQSAFGTPNTQAPTTAAPNVNLFANQGSGNLFGSSTHPVANKPAFSFGANANTMFGSQPATQQTMFGNANQTSAPSEMFPNANQTFNAPANPQMGMFGSMTPAFGAANQTTQGGMGQPSMLGQAQPAYNFGSPQGAMFNFGQQAAQPSPGMYNFGANAAPVQFSLGTSTGTPQPATASRRPVRRAVRRTQR